MSRQNGAAVNLPAPGIATHTRSKSVGMELVQQTDYRVGDHITLTVSLFLPTKCILRLWIPAGSKQSV